MKGLGDLMLPHNLRKERVPVRGTTDDPLPYDPLYDEPAPDKPEPGTIAKISHAGSNTAPRRTRAATSYADAGVNRDAATLAKERVARIARRSFNKNVLSEIGGFN